MRVLYDPHFGKVPKYRRISQQEREGGGWLGEEGMQVEWISSGEFLVLDFPQA